MMTLDITTVQHVGLVSNNRTDLQSKIICSFCVKLFSRNGPEQQLSTKDPFYLMI